jgi:hypothetical protein
MTILNNIQSFGSIFLNMLDRQSTGHETELLHSHINKAGNYNRWYTEEAVLLRLGQICHFLISDRFILAYEALIKRKFKKGIIYGIHSGENIPLEEFSTLLTVLLSGNTFIYKMSEKSDKLISFFFDSLGNNMNDLRDNIKFTDGNLKGADKFIVNRQKDDQAVIRKYFAERKTLFVIRHQSVAVLDGNENPVTLSLLGKDIFTFYGRGTGNVRKLYVPEGYDMAVFIKAIEDWHFLSDHSTHINNYNYYRTVYLLNSTPHFDNGFMLFKEDSELHAPTGVLFYEYYNDKTVLLKKLNLSAEVSSIYTSNPATDCEKKFGESIDQLLTPSVNLINFLS